MREIPPPAVRALEAKIDPFHPFHAEIKAFLAGQGVPAELVQLSIPPDPAFGHAASNAAFLLAKQRRQRPLDIANEIAEAFDPTTHHFLTGVEAAGGGFLNFHLNLDAFVPHTLNEVEDLGPIFGRAEATEIQNVLIEHTSVNPNKEWHVGHLRNVVLGDVLVRLARLAGHQVEVQNYIDDTGRQAAEAIAALQVYDAPPSEGEKFDQYVGRLYVKMNAELAGGEAGKQTASDAAQRTAELQERVEQVLHSLEAGSYRSLVEDIVRGQLQTAARVGAEYDLLVWESDIVRARLLTEALELLEKSPRVFIPDDGEYKNAMVIALDGHTSSRGEKNAAGEPEPLLRVLVRSNGLPTYTGKDIAYMMWKFGLLSGRLAVCDWSRNSGESALATTCPDGSPFHPSEPDRVINVVAEHQALPQQTVIEALAAAGYEEQARKAHHLSYGMVSQKEGRISGRKGSGMSADDALNEANAVARSRIREKRSDIEPDEESSIAEAIAVGAVRYLMVQHGAVKPIVFDMRDVVSFEGNTGLYLQYALVRIRAVLRRAAHDFGISDSDYLLGDSSLLTSEAERRLVLKLGRFPAAVEDAFRTLAANLIAEYANSLASEFSQFYRDCPVLPSEPDVRLARLRLVAATETVLTNAMNVLGIPVVDRL